MSLEIGGRAVGVESPLFVIAELGLNHDGDLGRALALVDAAARAGASAVKLQTFRSEELVAAECPAPAHVPHASLREFFRRFELDEEAHRLIAARARGQGLAFMATPFSLSAVDLLERVGVDAFKIASGDLTFLGLIERCAKTGRPLVMSTGMASLPEVADALAAARRAGAADLVLMHCVSAYPTEPGSENLRAIATLRAAFDTEVGLSDHASEPSGLPMAIALGAAVYERHLALRGDQGVDRPVSSLPDELAELVRLGVRAQLALGHGRKECLPVEAPNLDASRRSLRAARNLRSGDTIRAEDVVALRPSRGLAPARSADLIGIVLDRDVAVGEPFVPGDLTRGGGHRAVA